MKLLNLFTHEEPVAGLEISDSGLRLSLLKVLSGDKKNDKTKAEIKILAEEPLSNGIVVDGVVEKHKELAEALQRLFKKFKGKTSYVIVSIPANKIYSRTFSFPETVQGKRLEETMELAINFQLPVKVSDAYLDWEKVKNDKNEAFLAAVPKQVINGYLVAFSFTGFKIVAIEFHSMSFSRIIDIPGKNTVLVTASDKASFGVSIIKNKTLYFNRVMPNRFLPKKDAENEIRKITNFYEFENGPIDEIVDLSKARIIKNISGESLPKNNYQKWLISLGAAWRGLLPHAEDALVSLMPIGTEEAYEYQKATTFMGFILGMVVSLCVLFSIVFVGIWGLMVTVQKNTLAITNNLSSVPSQKNLSEMEGEVKKFNDLMNVSGDILEEIPTWSIVLEELKSRTTDDVLINELLFPSPNGVMNIKGVAKNREKLNLFKKTLSESSILSDITLPLTNLEQKEDIPFLITFKIRVESFFQDF